MTRHLPCLALVAALGGCHGPDGSADTAATASPALRSDVRVTEISLGRALEASRRVAEPADVFARTDTVYASVVTEGSAPRGLLRARWTYHDSEMVNESSLEIVPSGATVSEFHISRPEGLRAGSYEIEIFLDGVSAGKRAFSVK